MVEDDVTEPHIPVFLRLPYIPSTYLREHATWLKIRNQTTAACQLAGREWLIALFSVGNGNSAVFWAAMTRCLSYLGGKLLGV